MIDDDGNHRCAKCGGRNFTLKRTRRSKVMFGVGALATQKKKRCQDCGTYNTLGDPQPFSELRTASYDDDGYIA